MNILYDEISVKVVLSVMTMMTCSVTIIIKCDIVDTIYQLCSM